MRGVFFHVPVEKAVEPAGYECVTNRWWSVHPDKGLAFYAQLFGYGRSESPSPQCNSDESTARHLNERLRPGQGYEVKFFPVVFMSHASKELTRLRKTERESATT